MQLSDRKKKADVIEALDTPPQVLKLPLPGEKRTTHKVLKTFVLKMARAKARIWP